MYRHILGVSVKAVFSEDGQFRYRLTIEKSAGQVNKNVCVIMQNPSSADAEQADKSVQFLERLIFEKDNPLFENVSRLTIVNQFAHVQTNGFNGEYKYIGVENDDYISDSINEADMVLIAWGKINRYKERQRAINSILRNHPDKELFKTAKHPSRGFYDNFIEPYIPS